MQGSSRQSMVQARELLAARPAGSPQGGASLRLPDQLLSVAGAIGGDTLLRSTLSDPGTPPDMRKDVTRALFGGQLDEGTTDLVADVIGLRWSTGRDLVDAIEQLAAESAFTGAEQDGRIDAVENELFSFSRTLSASPELRATLTDPGLGDQAKSAIVAQLLEGKAQPETSLLLTYVVAHPRGRRIEVVLDELMEAAAVRREQLLAEVTVATPLTDEQHERLVAALAAIYGRPVTAQVVLDPEVLGGVVVRIGEEVIDGTVATKLAAARRVFG